MRAVQTLLIMTVIAALPASALAQQNREPERRAVFITRPGWLGINYTLTSINANGKQTESVTINDVVANSPAAKAGLKKGDRIVRIDGEPVTAQGFERVARSMKAGDSVKLRVASGSNERDVTVVADERPAEFFVFTPGNSLMSDSVHQRIRIYLDSARVRAGELFAMRPFNDSLFTERFRAMRPFTFDSIFPGGRIRIMADSFMITGEPPVEFRNFSFGFGEGGDGIFRRIENAGMYAVAGAEFEPINEGLGHYFGTDQGLLVLRVTPETPAARAGLEAGDVVVRAGGRAVNTVGALRQALARRDANVPVEVLRRGKTVRIELKSQRN